MPDNIIGPKIRRFRNQRNITQEQLAKILGYSGKSVISHIEKGDADMTYDKILLLLKLYNLDANELFDLNNVNNSVNNNGKKIAVYIHGAHGSSQEVSDYEFLKGRFDVVGLDYQDGNPWELKETIQKEFERITDGYEDIIVIANSIGAFYTYEYLSDYNIKQAFFISPIVSMFQTIVDLMVMYNIKDKQLEKKRFITLEDGTVLSFNFYQQVSNEDDSWDKPTEILYGSYDEQVYVQSMIEFLEKHPLAKLTVKEDAEHYFNSPEEKEFIRDWIIRNLAI